MGGTNLALTKFKRIESLKHNFEIIDIPFSGQTFTWRKKLLGDNNIWEPLDRAMVCSKFVERFQTTNI